MLLLFASQTFYSPTASAQTVSSTPLAITSATLAEGQAGVPLEANFEFTFDRKLPFSSINNIAFRFEPRQLAQRKRFFFGGDRSLEFTVEHAPNTDYVMFAFGALTCDPEGSRGQGCGENPQAPQPSRVYLQSRPYVRNYTTAPTAGEATASGTVAFSEISQPPAKSGGDVATLRSLIYEAFSNDHLDASGINAFDCTSAPSLQHTIVLLLDQYTFNMVGWRPRAGAAPVNGAFTMSNVREGQYWPIAINFADRCGQNIARYGYHDVNGDFAPDPVQVGPAGVSNLKIVLLRDEPILAREALAVAKKRRDALYPSAELQTVTALGPAADGRATLWRYRFYEPNDQVTATVDVGSFNTSLFTGDAPPNADSRLPLPETFVDSNDILQKAENDGGANFRALFPNQDVLLTVEVGDLSLPVRPEAPEVFWHVMYEAPFGAEPDTTLSLFYDAETGARLEGVRVAREAPEGTVGLRLDLPQPNPVRGQTTVAYAVEQGGYASLDVFDTLGRRVATLVDMYVAPGEHTASWNASTLPSGTYLLRLHADGRLAQQAVMVLR